MVGFTMCSNQECILGEMCDRSTAKRNKKQSFAHFFPEADNKRCSKFLPNEKQKMLDILSNDGKKKFDFWQADRVVSIRFLKERDHEPIHVFKTRQGLGVIDLECTICNEEKK